MDTAYDYDKGSVILQGRAYAKYNGMLSDKTYARCSE
jgi:hypothetical protein